MQHNYKSVKCILGGSAQTNKEVIFDAHEGTIKLNQQLGKVQSLRLLCQFKPDSQNHDTA